MQPENNVLRTRDAIVEAVHRSWWNVDRELGVGSELLFAEGGVCVMPALTMRGRHEIAEGYAKRQSNGPRLSRHLVSNLVATCTDSERAHASYALSLFAANGVAPLTVSSPSAICDVEDRFVLTYSGWLIEHRELTAVFVAPDNDSVMLRAGESR
ncbi:nuclear transport factor 2 family protein [Nocardia aurea]|uniref:nuclear transport factor 2 family protein n=1 Tax=Nocardia aurea TaxID=2144174 RepID=UPI001E2C2AE2|nr:nuclear transport factor 2 family protein [Nocardia aurea]